LIIEFLKVSYLGCSAQKRMIDDIMHWVLNKFTFISGEVFVSGYLKSTLRKHVYLTPYTC